MFLFGSPPSPEFLPLVSPQCPHQNADVWPRAARPREKGQRPAARSSSSSPHPRPLAHERGRPGPVDDRWGVCYARAPDPDTTQHNTRLCGPPQLGWNVTCFRLGPECVKHKWGRGGGHGWRDVGNGGAQALPRDESSEERVGFSVSAVLHENCCLSFIFFNQQSLFVLSDNKNASCSLCN